LVIMRIIFIDLIEVIDSHEIDDSIRREMYMLRNVPREELPAAGMCAKAMGLVYFLFDFDFADEKFATL
jgi:hypothetical protein